jgi:hypothetical protein
MKQAFAFMFKIVSKVFSFVVGVMWGAIKAMGKFLLTFVWESLKVIGKTVLKIGAFIFKMVIQIFTSMLASALGPIILILGGILLFVLIASGKLNGLWDSVMSFFGFGKDGKAKDKGSFFTTGFGKWLSESWDAVKNWFIEVWEGTNAVGRKLRDWFGGLFDKVYGFIGDMFNKATSIGGKFWKFLTDFGSWLGRLIFGENVEDSLKRLETNKKETIEEQDRLKFDLEKKEQEIKAIRAEYEKVYYTMTDGKSAELYKAETAKKLRDVWAQQDKLTEQLKNIPQQLEGIQKEIAESEKLKEEQGPEAQIPGWVQSLFSGFSANYKNMSLGQIFSSIILGNKSWTWSNPAKDSILGRVIHYFETAYEWMKVNIWQPTYAFLTDILFKITSAIVGGGEYIIDTLIGLLARVLRAVDKPDWADKLSGFAEGGRKKATSLVAVTRDLKLDAEQADTESKQTEAIKRAGKRYSEYLSSPEYHKYDSLPDQQRGIAKANMDVFIDEEMKKLGVTSESANKKQYVGIVGYGLNKLFKSRVAQLGFLNKDLGIESINSITKDANRSLSMMGFDGDAKSISAFHQLDADSALHPDNASINESIGLLSKFTDNNNVQSYKNLATMVAQDGQFMNQSEKKWKEPYIEEFDTSLGKAGEFGGGRRTKTRDGTFVGNLIEQKENEYNPGFLKWLSNQAYWLIPLGAALAAAAITVGTAGIGAPIAGTLLATVSAMGTAGVAGAKVGSAVTSASYAESLVREFSAKNAADPFAGASPLKFATGGIIKPPSAMAGGRMITVAEAGDPEIVVPLNAQGLQYIQEVSEKIQPIESSGAIRTNNDDILAAVLMLSEKITDKPVKKPFMASTNMQRSNNEKSDLLKMVSTGILTK